MGMYDSVMINCPKCGKEMELQSKSGECMLTNYPADDVSAAVAIGLNGDFWKCQFCDTTFVVRVPIPDAVKIKLEEVSVKEKMLWGLEDGKGPHILDGNYNPETPKNKAQQKRLLEAVKEKK